MKNNAPGDPVAAIDTPALVIDHDALLRNVARMASVARAAGLALRPHAKTHKCAHVAALQAEHGAVGVCVQKVSEAVALTSATDAAPPRDVLVTNEVIEPVKLDALFALLSGPRAPQRLGMAVDSTLGIQRAAEAWVRAGQPAGLELLVEIDVGQGRCGVPPAEAGNLARAVVAHGLAFAGLQAYHGGAQHRRRVADRQDAVRGAALAVASAHQSLARMGLAAARVTGGGTGTATIDAASGVWHELQAGSYVFMDRDYADNEGPADAAGFEHALFVKSRVHSRSRTHAVIDAGHKSHALDSGPPRVAHGPWTWANAGDEHGRLEAPAGVALPALGDTVWLVPGHCDPTVNLHDRYVVVQGGLAQGRVLDTWPVHARGCLR
jgi:D-serine deaminase-like pyridoxal phosphate-dependent protein